MSVVSVVVVVIVDSFIDPESFGRIVNLRMYG